jgi:hypothetical protein
MRMRLYAVVVPGTAGLRPVLLSWVGYAIAGA